MTDPTPNTPPADPYAESLRRSIELASLADSEPAQAVRRYLLADGNGVSWTALLRELGGISNLPALLDDEGQPDPERINPLIDRIFHRTAVRESAGMTITYGLKNR